MAAVARGLPLHAHVRRWRRRTCDSICMPMVHYLAVWRDRRQGSGGRGAPRVHQAMLLIPMRCSKCVSQHTNAAPRGIAPNVLSAWLSPRIDPRQRQNVPHTAPQLRFFGTGFQCRPKATSRALPRPGYARKRPTMFGQACGVRIFFAPPKQNLSAFCISETAAAWMEWAKLAQKFVFHPHRNSRMAC